MRISPDFGQIIRELKDELGSFGKLSIKVNISKAYLVEMAAGKVPGPEYVERVADRYPHLAPRIFASAGYTLPDRFRDDTTDDPALKNVMVKFRGLRLESSRRRVEQIIQEILDEESRADRDAEAD
jgi:hypothetical protein